MTLPHVENVLHRLDGVKPAGPDQWTSRCPSHGDSRPSLSIGVGRDDRVVLSCHAGCKNKQILDTIGLGWPDLWPEGSPKRELWNGKRGGNIVATYDYHDADGELLFQVCRMEPKSFRQRRPDGNGGWTWNLNGARRVPYRLPELQAAPLDRWVYVVEGEKDADAGAKIGLTITTSAQGANNARQTDWAALAGRRVCIVADNDEAGHEYAEAVAELLAGVAAEVKIIDLPDVPPKGDLADFIEARDSRTAEQIVAELESLADAAEPFVADDVAPVRPERHAYRSFPLEALPTCMREMVTAVAKCTNTDPAYGGVASLAIVAGCIGNRFWATAKSGFSVPPTLWAGIVGKSGTTKSPVLGLLMRPLHEIRRRDRKQFEQNVAAYNEALRKHKAAMKEADVGDDDTLTPPKLTPERRVYVGDATIEKLGVLLQENPAGLLLSADELAAWVGRWDRYASGKGSDGTAWLSMHDADALTVDRVNGTTLFVPRAAVSVVGGIQPGVLDRCFGRAERDAGVLARLLLTHPPERSARWTDEDLPERVAEQWAALLTQIVDIEYSGDPKFLGLSGDAKREYAAWYNAHGDEIHDTADDDLRAHFSKLRGVALRVGAVLATVEALERHVRPTRIEADTIRRAIDIAEWFKNEARRIYATLRESDEDRDRRQIVELIERKGGRVSARDLCRHNSSKYRTAADAEVALDQLAADGWGRWEYQPPGPKGGRQRREFVLTPAGGVENGGCVMCHVAERVPA